MTFEIIIGVIIALIIYSIVHRIFVVNPEKKYQKSNKNHVDSDVFKMITKVQQQNQQLKFIHFITSTVQTDVWGRGVLVYEYKYKIKTDLELLKIRFLLEGNLAQQTTNRHKLIITDCWLNNDILTFDVADEQNNATEEYVDDIKKIDQK